MTQQLHESERSFLSSNISDPKCEEVERKSSFFPTLFGSKRNLVLFFSNFECHLHENNYEHSAQKYDKSHDQQQRARYYCYAVLLLYQCICRQLMSEF